MSNSDPIDVHRALQQAARELAHYADVGSAREYFDAIDNLEKKLRAVRRLRVNAAFADVLDRHAGVFEALKDL